MKINLIGDTHGYDIEKIKRNLDCDYLIVLGDFDFRGRRLIQLNELLEKKQSKVLFVDGNHEHYKKLIHSKEEILFGGKVGRYAQNIYWLKRGEIYTINGKKILTIGGAKSIDRAFLIEGQTWFKEEECSKKDIQNIYDNLSKHKYKIDYILTHDCPAFIGNYILYPNTVGYNTTSILLQNISCTCSFNKWFFGHHHIDLVKDNYICLWNNSYTLEI